MAHGETCAGAGGGVPERNDRASGDFEPGDAAETFLHEPLRHRGRARGGQGVEGVGHVKVTSCESRLTEGNVEDAVEEHVGKVARDGQFVAIGPRRGGIEDSCK